MSDRADTIVHRWFEEVWNQGRAEAIDALLAVDAPVHGPEGAEVVGPDAFKAFQQQFRAAIPDIKITVEDTVVEGDKIAARCTVTGTHSGPGLAAPAAGKSVRITGLCIARVAGDKIVEAWNCFDFLSLYQQLGMRLS